jgi:hypothetical protein
MWHKLTDSKIDSIRGATVRNCRKIWDDYSWQFRYFCNDWVNQWIIPLLRENIFYTSCRIQEFFSLFYITPSCIGNSWMTTHLDSRPDFQFYSNCIALRIVVSMRHDSSFRKKNYSICMAQLRSEYLLTSHPVYKTITE